MYSMVLMAALTTGGTTLDCCHRCGGCCGCYGGCYGCYGCGGCWGGCYGCGGCYGGCYGCGGGYGCWGGYSSWGCGGCYGGCYGGFGGYAGAPIISGGYSGGAVIVPGTGTGTGTGTGSEQLGKPKPDKDKESMASPNRAKLIVELPADARLYIDDIPMKTTSSKRAFNTPELDRGQSYYYIVKAEVVRDGKPVTQTRRVIVRAGEVIRANFSDLAAEPVVTTARAR